MARVKRGKFHIKKRKRLLAKTKGFKAGRKNKIKLAKPAAWKAGVYAYRDRKQKKRFKRNIWTMTINAAARKYDISYSKFINALKKHNISLDRKTLATLAQKNPLVFEAIIKNVKS